MLNNPKLDVFNINAYAKFCQIHSFIHKILSGNEILGKICLHTKDIKRKRNYDIIPGP